MARLHHNRPRYCCRALGPSSPSAMSGEHGDRRQVALLPSIQRLFWTLWLVSGTKDIHDRWRVLHGINVTRYRDHLAGQLLAVVVTSNSSESRTIDHAVILSNSAVRMFTSQTQWDITFSKLPLGSDDDLILFSMCYSPALAISWQGCTKLENGEELFYSSSLPNADIVSALANLMSSLRLPMRNSFQSAVTKSLAFFPNG